MAIRKYNASEIMECERPAPEDAANDPFDALGAEVLAKMHDVVDRMQALDGFEPSDIVALAAEVSYECLVKWTTFDGLITALPIAMQAWKMRTSALMAERLREMPDAPFGLQQMHEAIARGEDPGTMPQARTADEITELEGMDGDTFTFGSPAITMEGAFRLPPDVRMSPKDFDRFVEFMRPKMMRVEH